MSKPKVEYPFYPASSLRGFTTTKTKIGASVFREEDATPGSFVLQRHDDGLKGMNIPDRAYRGDRGRFLYGDVKVTGILEVEEIYLPPSLKKEFGRALQNNRISYFFETAVSLRDAAANKLIEVRRDTFSAIFRVVDGKLRLFKLKMIRPHFPELFTVFLNRSPKTGSSSMVFNIDLTVSTNGYKIDDFLMLSSRNPGEHLFRNTLPIHITETDIGWYVNYNPMDDEGGEPNRKKIRQDNQGYYISLSAPNGFKGKLRLKAGS